MKHNLIFLLVIVCMSLLGIASEIIKSAHADNGPKALTVVELFTSQGCSSCPAADALLGDLTTEYGDHILPLSYHVDYWNYIGWQDPFSSSVFSQYQRRYASAMNSTRVYTPQIIVNGRHDMVGSYRNKVLSAIVKSKGETEPLHIETSYDLNLQELTIDIGAYEALKNSHMTLVAYLPQATTKVARGENKGREITNHHIVQHINELGVYDGGAHKWTVHKPSDHQAAILFRDPSTYHILAASRL